MFFKDFLFSYKNSIQREIKKKKYFKSLRKLLNIFYKFFLDKLRQILKINKINLDNHKEKETLKKFNIDQLFKFFNADKATEVIIDDKLIQGHNYSQFYEKHLSKFKSKSNLNILEIGSLRGAAAASFFYYFNKPNIVCADINPFQNKIFSKNIRKIFIDTQSKQIIHNLNKHLNKSFDIIIDDASHNVRDQIITFNEFFKKVNHGGLYIIEDTAQYKASPHLDPDNLNSGIREFLESLDNEENVFNKYLSKIEIENIRSSIGNIFFEKGNYILNNVNISEIVFIEKL